MGIIQARILEWVAMPSSRGSSQLRDQNCIYCIGRRVIYHGAARGAQIDTMIDIKWICIYNFKKKYLNFKTLAHGIVGLPSLESIRQVDRLKRRQELMLWSWHSIFSAGNLSICSSDLETIRTRPPYTLLGSSLTSFLMYAAAAKSSQWCLTLCDPMDCM